MIRAHALRGYPLGVSCQHLWLTGREDKQRAKGKKNVEWTVISAFRRERQPGSNVASTSGTDNNRMISEGGSWIWTCLNTRCWRTCLYRNTARTEDRGDRTEGRTGCHRVCQTRQVVTLSVTCLIAASSEHSENVVTLHQNVFPL